MAARGIWLPMGLLGAIALVVGVETAIERRELDTVSPIGWQYSLASRSAVRKAAGCEVLAFGDSLLKYAFLPAVIERRHGPRSYNLAVTGSQAPYNYYVFRRVLEGGARPSAVLIEYFPSSLSTGPRLNAGDLPHFLGVGECLELGLTARDAGLLGQLLAGRVFPSVRCRSALRAAAISLVTRKPNGTRFDNTWLLPWWEKNRGAQLMHATPESAIDVRVWQQVAFPATWSSDPVNDAYVGRFLDLAARRGVAVYWVLTPLAPRLQVECERSGFDARYLAYVRDWQRRYPALRVIDGRHAEYDPAVFTSDPAHLGREGAYVFSVDVGAVLRRRGRDSERWHTLPRYRPLTPDGDLEDDLAARITAFGPRSVTR